MKAAIEDLETREADWEDKALSKNEWKLLEGAVKLLEQFRETTKLWQYESIPTINMVVDRVYCMEEELTEFISDRKNDKFGITFAKELKKNLEKRFPNHGLDSFDRRVGNYLDPHLKGIHLRKFKVIDSTKDEVERAVKDDQDEIPLGEDTGEELIERNNNLVAQDMSPTAKLRMEMDALEPSQVDTSKIRIEMALYEKMELATKQVNVLEWWKGHENTLPTLARFARKALSIPASSGKSERVFSTGGNFVTVKRTRLNALKVQGLIVIKENRKQIKLYLANLGNEKLPEVDVDGEEAFEKVKVVEKVILNDLLGSDEEPFSYDDTTSDDEYYMDED